MPWNKFPHTQGIRVSAELAAKIKDLVDTPGISLNKMQQANLEAKTIYGEALKTRWGASFAEEVLSHSKRVDRSIDVLNRMLMGSIPKVIEKSLRSK